MTLEEYIIVAIAIPVVAVAGLVLFGQYLKRRNKDESV